MAFFSVIIPVYNVAVYLEQCIDSVLAQNFSDYEVILVDDGSTDQSGSICDRYAANKKHISVIHKKNGGLSSARNSGIRNAKGEYILFLDSDDYWNDIDALAKLYERINRHQKTEDVIMSLATLLFPDGAMRYDREISAYQGFEAMNSDMALRELIRKGLFPGSACTVTIRKDFIVNNHLYFVEGIKSEDIEWSFRLAYCSPVYGYPDQRFYVYRKGRIGSITATINFYHLCQYLDIIEGVQKYDFVNEVQKDSLLGLAAYHLSIIMGLTARIQKSAERKELIRRIKKNRSLFDYILNQKAEKVSKLQKVIGLPAACRVLGLYILLKNM